MTSAQYVKKVYDLMYGPNSIFTREEQAAMQRGYTMAERRNASGRIWGIYPQAISSEHAAKLDEMHRQLR